MESILECSRLSGMVQKFGGGVGVNLSKLRAKGKAIRSTHGKACGPIAVMKYLAATSQMVTQGGSRAGANIAILDVEHPDAVEFIKVKATESERLLEAARAYAAGEVAAGRWSKEEGDRHVAYCSNAGMFQLFNLSLAVNRGFMTAAMAYEAWKASGRQKADSEAKLWQRILPCGQSVAEVWDLIVSMAARTGDPGLVFMDRIREIAKTQSPNEIAGTNPCGEVPLPAGGSCNLGSIDLSKFVDDGRSVGKAPEDCIDWEGLEETIRLGVRFLDDVIDVNRHADPLIEKVNKEERRLGLGVMGWADMLLKLGIPYASNEAVQFAERVGTFFCSVAHNASYDLAEERGPFPLWEKLKDVDPPDGQVVGCSWRGFDETIPRRNAAVTCIAPTGTISLLAGCSSGIEPHFDAGYVHSGMADRGGVGFVWASETILRMVQRHCALNVGNEVKAGREMLRDAGWLPANDVPIGYHIQHQAVWQRNIDSSISKCLAAGTLVPTDKGLMRIEDFSDVEQDDTFKEPKDSFMTGGHRIVSHYRAGLKQSTRVRLDNGTEIVGATQSHRVLTIDGWKLLGELQPQKDYVIGGFEKSHGIGSMTIEWTDVFNNNANRIVTPKQMSPDLAEWLGMLAADGGMLESTGCVGLTKKNVDVENRFRELSQNLFGVNPRKAIDARNGTVTQILTSRNLCRYVISLIGVGAYEKTVPDQILLGNAEEKLAFLRGLSLDGYVTEGYGLCVYGGMSKKLAYYASEIARSFGLPQVYLGTKKVVGASKHGSPAYQVVVSCELQGLISCIETHKNISPVMRDYRVLLTDGLADQVMNECDSKSPIYSTWRSIKQRKHRFAYRSTVEAVGGSIDTPVYRVTHVEDAGLVELFDVEVEDSHQYLVNGIVSHNTVNMSHSATEADVAKVYLMAYREGCKGCTVYRDRCKAEQVLNKVEEKPREEKEAHPVPEAPAAPVAAKPVGQKRARKQRPRVVKSVTYKVETAEGKMYLTVGYDEARMPFELFVKLGKTGTSTNGYLDAICKLISDELRLGAHPFFVVRALRGIRTVPHGMGPNRVLSVPDAIGKVLEEYMVENFGPEWGAAYGWFVPQAEAHEDGGNGGNGHEITLSAIERLPAAEVRNCPECGNELVLATGCFQCMVCGYSKCE
jgi:ribonucleoside-diphosphate reductase alpha chain